TNPNRTSIRQAIRLAFPGYPFLREDLMVIPRRWLTDPISLPSRRAPMELDLFHSGVTSLVHSIELFAESAERNDRLRFALIAFDGVSVWLLKRQPPQEHKFLIFQDAARPLGFADFEPVLRRREPLAFYPLLKPLVPRLPGVTRLRPEARHMRWNISAEQA